MLYNISLTKDEVNMVAAGLGKLPMEHAIVLFTKLKMQCLEQEKAASSSSSSETSNAEVEAKVAEIAQLPGQNS